MRMFILRTLKWLRNSVYRFECVCICVCMCVYLIMCVSLITCVCLIMCVCVCVNVKSASGVEFKVWRINLPYRESVEPAVIYS